MSIYTDLIEENKGEKVMLDVVKVKNITARILGSMMVTNISFNLLNLLLKNKYIRVINYHNVQSSNILNFKRQLEYYHRHYYSVSLYEFESFLFDLDWPHKRPGIIVTFDDGDKSHIKIVAPILDKYGFQGWFFVPVALLGQPGYLSNSDLRLMDKNHNIGSHTNMHLRLKKDTPAPILNFEIFTSKLILEDILGHEVKSFCWVGGELGSYSKNAYECIKKTGYKYAFMTNSYPVRFNTDHYILQRTNIEASWPLGLVKLQLSGLIDLFYTPKRLYINRIIK